MTGNMDPDPQFSDEHMYAIALGMFPKVGPATARKLIQHFGGARAIFEARRNDLRKVLGNSYFRIRLNKDKRILKRASEELEFCMKQGVSILLPNDPRFPKRLSFCSDAPYLLFIKGQASLNPERMIAIVGTRGATDYGKRQTHDLVADLAGKGISVISGLARGIDGCAHLACLKHGVDTIGVIGHGLDSMSPAAHRKLAADMIASGGAVLTEYLSGTPADKYSFPARNRIIAGMADAVIVVESANKGGALITADIAQSYNRDVFTIPGKTTDRYSVGCNRLIKNHKAMLVENGRDVIFHMGWDASSTGAGMPARQRSFFPELSEEEAILVGLFQKANRKIHFDEITGGTQLLPGLVRSILLGLELKGVVHSIPGNMYELS